MTNLGLGTSRPPAYNARHSAAATWGLPAYSNGQYTANPQTDIEQLSRAIAPGSRAGSILRTKLVIGIDFGTT